MGQMTRAEIVAQGLAEAGMDTTYQPLVETDFNKRLQRIYDAWPWPFLVRRISGVPLLLGATSLSFGAGAGGVTAKVKRILDPIYLSNSDFSAAGMVRIRTLTGGPISLDEAVFNPASFRGLPTQMKVRADAVVFGKWTLYPTPVPDRSYLLALDYIESPDPIPVGATGDNTRPIYPNDALLVKIVEVFSLHHQRHETYPQEQEVLAAMVVQDRVTYGSVDGINDVLPMDGSVFL